VQARQDMEVKDDAEWTAIESKITAVQTAQRANSAAVVAVGAVVVVAAWWRRRCCQPESDGRRSSSFAKAYDDKAPAADVKAAIAKVQGLRKTMQPL